MNSTINRYKYRFNNRGLLDLVILSLNRTHLPFWAVVRFGIAFSRNGNKISTQKPKNIQVVISHFQLPCVHYYL